MIPHGSRASWYHAAVSVEQLRNVHRAQPFRPFTIHMGDGRAFLVRHPDYLSHSPPGRTVVVYQDDESFSVLDLLLVTELEAQPPPQRGDAAARPSIVVVDGADVGAFGTCMRRINEANRSYLAPFVCVACRRSFKRPRTKGVTHRPCPVCGNPAVRLSRKFKPPRATDDEQWEKVRLLIAHGFFFESIHDDDRALVHYPESLSEAREWVKKWAHKATPAAAPTRRR
jgi:hypothetical protein